jgi:hypothetical protein
MTMSTVRGGDDKAAPYSRERNRADVLIVGDERHPAEQRGDGGAEAVGGDRAAYAPLGAFDAEHPA